MRLKHIVQSELNTSDVIEIMNIIASDDRKCTMHVTWSTWNVLKQLVGVSSRMFAPIKTCTCLEELCFKNKVIPAVCVFTSDVLMLDL